MSENYAMTNATPAPADNLIGRLRQSLVELPSSSRLSRTDTEAIYAMAYNQVMQGQIELANGYLSLLTLYAPTTTKYLCGLGLTYKLLKAYDEALSIYTFAAALEPHQPQITVSIAEVQMLQGDFERSRESLTLVVNYCANHQEAASIGKRAQTMLDLISSAHRQGDASD